MGFKKERRRWKVHIIFLYFLILIGFINCTPQKDFFNNNSTNLIVLFGSSECLMCNGVLVKYLDMASNLNCRVFVVSEHQYLSNQPRLINLDSINFISSLKTIHQIKNQLNIDYQIVKPVLIIYKNGEIVYENNFSKSFDSKIIASFLHEK